MTLTSAATTAPPETEADRKALDLKRWATLQARAALVSVTASLLEMDDGRVQVVASRWALTRAFISLDEFQRWLDTMGAPG